MNSKKNYYKILNIEKNATAKEIRNVYKQLALKWHPDKNPDKKKEAEEKFKEIYEAYLVLSDPNKKNEYDRINFNSFNANNNYNFRKNDYQPQINNYLREMQNYYINRQKDKLEKINQGIPINSNDFIYDTLVLMLLQILMKDHNK